MAEVNEGLRERKKRMTTEAIAAAAMALFREHGFDAVTVADVARAADVSEKTVYNHFPTKESLVFSGRDGRYAELIEELRALPKGASIVDPFRNITFGWIGRMAAQPVEHSVGANLLVRDSQALKTHLMRTFEGEAEAIADVLSMRGRRRTSDLLVAGAVARALLGVHLSIFRGGVRQLHEGADPKKLARALKRDATRAYDLLENGLGSY